MPPPAVTLDSRFDDLGLGSLELAELLRRVQNAYGVALPAHLLSQAETPRDLVRALSSSRVPAGSGFGVPSTLATAEASPAPAPAAAVTLIDALDWHVGATPARTHIRILDEDGNADEVTYESLHRQAGAVAAGLLQDYDVMPGDRVAIMLPTSRAYFTTFTGTVLAGAVPVPLYPPAQPSQLAEHLRRHIGILRNAGAAVLVTVPEAVALGQLLRSNVDSLRQVVVPESLMGTLGGVLPRPRCLMVSRIGRPVTQPAIIDIKLASKDGRPIDRYRAQVEDVVTDHLSQIPQLIDRFVDGVISVT
jgi:acyl carrier protein